MSEPTQPKRSPAAITPADTPGLSSLLALAVAVVVIAALYFAREVLIPITVAVILSFMLAPLVSRMQRWHVPHAVAVILAVVIAIGVVGGIAAVIGTQVAGIAAEVPQYSATIRRKVTAVQSMTTGRIRGLTARLDQQVGHAPTQPNAEAAAPAAGEAPKAQLVQVEPPQTSALEIARTVLEPVLSPLATLFIILIVTIFVLMQREDLRDRMIRLFGSNDLQRTTVALDDAGHRLGRYYLSQLAINVCFGVVATVGLYFIGVPSALLWGVTSAVLRFVPYIGPVIAAVLPAALAAAVDPGWTPVLEVVGLYLVVETITGQFIEPLVFGHLTGLSPAAVVIAAIFWTWLWGPIGLLLSTPLTLCLVVLGRHVDRLEFFDVMLGDRPALTPVENFYQRMLADDPDEAQAQAEVLLKGRSLTGYYDEVALKGLQLAANDALRGALSAHKVDTIKDSVKALIADLAGHEDRDPHPKDKAAARASATRAERAVPVPGAPKADAPVESALAPRWRSETPVLCIAGKGPLDEAASAMLVQLLGKHGLGARAAAYGAASRQDVGSLDVAGVAMVCISYLEISGSPSGLHYLVRRIRARLPDAKILVGLWPAEGEGLEDDRIRHIVGADVYASNLKHAVDACVAAAHEDSGTVPSERPDDTGGEAQVGTNRRPSRHRGRSPSRSEDPSNAGLAFGRRAPISPLSRAGWCIDHGCTGGHHPGTVNERRDVSRWMICGDGHLARNSAEGPRPATIFVVGLFVLGARVARGVTPPRSGRRSEMDHMTDSLHGVTPAPDDPTAGAVGASGDEVGRTAAVMARLATADPDPKAGLGGGDPFQLLVTVLMSAQSTGPTVGRIARDLFAAAPTPNAIVALGRERVAEIIKPVGLAGNKSRHIVGLSAMLLDAFGGTMPRTSAEMRRFPGIGRKTADVTANFAFGEPVIGVDTHVFRVSNRIPLAPGKTPDAVADGLLAAVPERYKDGAHVWLFRHGRDTCTARRPACARCIVADLCSWPGKEISS